jgi:hypothetical protein
MANANGTSTRTSGENEEKPVYAFNRMITPFAEERMARHNELLGHAAKHLSDAYATAGAIDTIASIVRRSRLALDRSDPALTPNHEDHLLSAIELLAGGLVETLDCSAAWFAARIKKGGAQ